MICDAPAQPLEPPAWRIPAPEAGGEESVLLGFVAIGSQEDITKLANAAEGAGLHCGLPQTDDGRIEIMVMFDRNSTRDGAHSFYKRVEAGEFGKFTNVGLMIAPASAVKKP